MQTDYNSCKNNNCSRIEMRLYKYLEKQYLEGFKEKGIVHLSTLDELRIIEKKDIGDKLEGINVVKVGKRKTVRFSGKELENYRVPIQMSDKSEANFTNCTFITFQNGYVFCTTAKRNDNYWVSRGCDAHFVINDSSRFCQTLFNKLYDFWGVDGFCENFVVYVNNREKVLEEEGKADYLKNDLIHPYSSCFQKSTDFKIQSEYRMFFICKGVVKPQPPIACPELIKYCTFE
jgi:hypothetical protein